MKNVFLLLFIIFCANIAYSQTINATPEVTVLGTYQSMETTTLQNGSHSVEICCAISESVCYVVAATPCITNPNISYEDLNSINECPTFIILKVEGIIVDQGIATSYSNNSINGNLLNRAHNFVLLQQ
jgi:hypothetical protein